MMKKHGAESLISVINKRTRIFNIVLLFYDTYAAIKKVSIFNKSQKNQIFWKKENIFSHKTVLTIHIAPLYRNLYCIGKKLSIPSPSLYSISIRCWFVKTKIWNKDIYFLVDTGSSLISNEIFDSLLGNKDLLDLQTILTADGDLLSVKGKTDVDLCINEMECSTTLVVAQLGDLSCILGLDFLPEYEAKMDMNAGRIHSPFFGEIGLVKEDNLQSTCTRIHMTETVSISAKCEMFVKGSTNCAFSQKDC